VREQLGGIIEESRPLRPSIVQNLQQSPQAFGRRRTHQFLLTKVRGHRANADLHRRGVRWNRGGPLAV